MMNTTIKNQDKIKLLDQMLEDMAGDELEDNGDSGTDVGVSFKRYSENEPFETIDYIH